MRRSRALTLFGWFLTMLAVATVTARSHAADRMRLRIAASGALAANPSEPLELLPRTTNHDAALLESFLKPGTTHLEATGEATGQAACPSEMVEVQGDYCPYLQQKCVRWLDPATGLQCAEFDKGATQ